MGPGPGRLYWQRIGNGRPAALNLVPPGPRRDGRPPKAQSPPRRERLLRVGTASKSASFLRRPRDGFPLSPKSERVWTGGRGVRTAIAAGLPLSCYVARAAQIAA